MNRIVRFALLGSIAWSTAAHAQWPDGGALVCGSALDERGVRCAADGMGRFWVAWGESSPVDTTLGLVRLARWNEAGQLVDGWNACGIQVGDTTRASTDFQLASDGGLGVYIAWTERRGQASRVLCQHFDPSGLPAAGWPVQGMVLADTSTGPRAPRVFADDSGGVYVAWYEAGYPPDTNPSSGLRGLRILADGTLAPGWAAGGKVLLNFAAGGWTVDPDGAGGILVVSRRYSGGAFYELVMTRYLSGGERAEGWIPLGNPVGGTADRWAVAPDGLGGAFIRWSDGSLRLQHLTDMGGVSPGWTTTGIVVATSVSDDGALLADDAGGVFLATTRFAAPVNDLFLQRFGADSQPSPGWPAGGYRVTFDIEFEQTVFLVPDHSGGAFLTWTTSNQLKTQRRLANGTFPAGWPSGGLVLANGVDGVAFPRSVAASGTAMLVSWATHSAGGNDRDSRILLVQSDGQAGATVDVPGRDSGVLALRATPNPAVGETVFAFELAGESDVTLDIHDLAGRLVWSQSRTAVPAGPSRWRWSGRDRGGVPEPKGVYFARLSTRWGTSRTAIVRM